MASLNRATLIGNLGRDPEIRYTQSGDPIANFPIATSESWKDKQTGEKKEITEWHQIVVFNENIAKVAQQYLKKGAKVYIEGQIKTRKWTDKDGVERYSTEIVIGRFDGKLILLGENERRGPPPAQSEENYGRTRDKTPPKEDRGNYAADLYDDIPF